MIIGWEAGKKNTCEMRVKVTKFSTYRSKTGNLSREPHSHILWNTIKVKAEARKRLSVVFLPLSNILHCLCRRSFDILRDSDSLAPLTSSHELPLKGVGLCVGTA